MNVLESLSQELTSLANTAAPWVVRVNGRRGPNATGVFWSPSIVLTSHRGTQRESEIEVGLPDGSVVLAQVAGRAPSMDLATLSLKEPVDLAPTPWSEQNHPGMVMALARDRQGNLLTKVGLLPGEHLGHRMSPAPEFLGSPLLDIKGKFLGLHLLVGHPRVVPFAEIRTVIERLDSGENLEAGFLGLGLHRVDHLDGPACLAVKVEGPAKQAGLKVGDILITLDGAKVTDPETARDLLRTKAAGSSIELLLVRAGQSMTRSVVLDRRPEPDFPGHLKHHMRRVMRHFKHHHHPGPPPHDRGPEVC